MFDIVVVGGNLSGSAAAIHAAEREGKVALIERNKEPHFPARCGEGTVDVVLEILPIDTDTISKNKITNIIINVETKKYSLHTKDHGIIIFDRHQTEKELLKKADQVGVELYLGRSMRDFNPPHTIVLNNKEQIKVRVILDASGIACQIGRRIGMDTKLATEDIGVCIQSRVKSNFDADTIQMWFHRPYAPFGYAWLFPIDEETANIGIGVMGGQQLDLQELLNDYIDDVIGGKYKILHTFRACVPLGPPLHRLVKDNVMVLGDAARLANPATGSGIGNALFSGSLAGIIATDFAKEKLPDLELYQHLMSNTIVRLDKIYRRRRRLTTDKKFIAGYNKAFFSLSIINRLFSTLLEKHVVKIFRKDISLIKKYQTS
jgi:digeranylgeranylglycerophospholipid reductase